MPLNIAIDGPVGAGKSSVADEVARRLGILHLDTGAMYRAIGLAALRSGIPLDDEDAVTALAGTVQVDVRQSAEGQRTLLDGEDVSGEIRTEEVSQAASKVSSYGGVRALMVQAQQRIAAGGDMLLDGRDIGFRVLPDAQVKIYLTASAEERARRRWLQLQQKGSGESYEQVLSDLMRRDLHDSTRAVDPLHPAEDAVIVDSSDLDFEETVQRVLAICEEKRHA